ncbi:MAG: electron transfer flavoprotein subunit alpha/FixB family protein [Gammaproteobacteria bacterium]|jgi:electron transfer flavoprotein alpha subunit|nr:electron transfer flavoprotein subunit alpha/FixB family protein [Gammaproteobacteria bacterium]
MSGTKGVVAVCDLAAGKLSDIAREVLGCGRRLADDLGAPLEAVVLGSGLDPGVVETVAKATDRLFVADHPALIEFHPETYLAALLQIVGRADPQVVILGQTALGRDLAPRLAFRLGSCATLDCVDVRIDAETRRLLQTKPVYGGNAHAVYCSPFDPQVVTIRAKCMPALIASGDRKAETIVVDIGDVAARQRIKSLGVVREKVDGTRLEDARVVVGGGRGIGGSEGFALLEELALVLGGTTGASRAVCDNGWQPVSRQIGLTGKVVSPDLYLAVAISGASQHMAGCHGARNIVAINKDEEANIFREARYGVVGDWREVVPGLVSRLNELRAAQA